MAALIALYVGAFLLGVAFALGAMWWERRKATRRHQRPQEPLPDECEVCGARNPDNVTVGAVTARPGQGGFSGITATWCLEHYPDEHRPAA